MAFENFVVEIYRNAKILIMMENLSSYPEWSVMLNTLHQFLSYAVKDRLTFEISSREHPHQELVMHKYVLLGEGVKIYGNFGFGFGFFVNFGFV